MPRILGPRSLLPWVLRQWFQAARRGKLRGPQAAVLPPSSPSTKLSVPRVGVCHLEKFTIVPNPSSRALTLRFYLRRKTNRKTAPNFFRKELTSFETGSEEIQTFIVLSRTVEGKEKRKRKRLWRLW